MPNQWTTAPEFTNLLNYLIEQTRNVEAPMIVQRMAKEFKEKSGATDTEKTFVLRISRLRARIPTFAHIDTNTKVRLLFALSASVDAKFLKKLKKEALVKVDDQKRIIHYKANDGTLELNGDHSSSAKTKTARFESKGSHRSLIINYFQTKDDADAVPKNKEEKEMGNLIELITEKCENVKSPLSISRLAKDFIDKCQTSIPPSTVRSRINGYGLEIQRMEFVDTRSKIKQLFGLSATVNSDYLEKLRKDATVEVDEKNRITSYKATDGSLELGGEHSRTAKMGNAQFEYQKIRNYYINKNNSDAVPKNGEKKEMENFIEFITEKCENADSPLSIKQLVRDFNKHFGTSRSFHCIYDRVKRYCNEIQNIEFMDTHTKVRQLFCLSEKLSSEHLKKLRKTAVVEVDQENRIIKYISNDGSLILRGSHWGSKKGEPKRVEKRNKINVVAMLDNSEEESDDEGLDDSSDEYSSEEFGSEFDSDEENDLLDKTKDLTEPSNETDHFDNKNPVGNSSSAEIPIGDNFDFDPSTERSHRSEKTEMIEDQKNDPDITGNGAVKTRYGRLSKRRHMDSGFSYKQANSSSSEVPMGTDSLSSKSVKQKKSATQKEQATRSSNQNRSLSRSMRRFTRNSSFPSISTDSEEKIENQDAQRAVDFDNERSMRNDSPTEMSIDDNFDFDPPTERSHTPEETEMREDDEEEDPEITRNSEGEPQKLHQLTPKRKADAPAGSSTSKRTKPPSDKSVNSVEMNDNSSHDDPPRIELKPFCGLLGLPNETQKDADIQQIPKPRPQVMEAPIKKEYEEEAHTSLRMVLNAFKSLILSLDTPGLSQFLMELDKKIMEAGRKIEISNKEVILAMELLIVKLANYGAPKSSADSISLREILSMLRTILLTLKFNGFEVILEMLKVNIEQLKVQDKKVPVSKAECVLRATLDIICT